MSTSGADFYLLSADFEAIQTQKSPVARGLCWGRAARLADSAGVAWLLAAQLGQRVLQRLDEPLNVLWRHLNPGRGDGQASRCLGRVLEPDERLAAHDARADAGELEDG